MASSVASSSCSRSGVAVSGATGSSKRSRSTGCTETPTAPFAGSTCSRRGPPCTSSPSRMPSPSVSGFSGSVPKRSSAPSRRPSSSLSASKGSVPRASSSALLSPSSSGSSPVSSRNGSVPSPTSWPFVRPSPSSSAAAARSSSITSGTRRAGLTTISASPHSPESPLTAVKRMRFTPAIASISSAASRTGAGSSRMPLSKSTVPSPAKSSRRPLAMSKPFANSRFPKISTRPTLAASASSSSTNSPGWAGRRENQEVPRIPSKARDTGRLALNSELARSTEPGRSARFSDSTTMAPIFSVPSPGTVRAGAGKLPRST